MARGQSLLSSEPTGILQQPVTIGHVQLRDVLLCPEERGIVNFVRNQTILERDTRDPTTVAYPLANLGFVPNTIASLPIPGSEERLIAAGGQEAELHLSIHSSRPTGAEPRRAWMGRPRRLWQFDNVLTGSINNSVLLTSLSLTRSHESSAEPRVAVSNNDCTVKFYDVNVRGARGPEGLCKRISEAGTLRIDVPVNHSSISPDGRTLLSVGDSPHVYLHALSGGSRITFTELYKLTLPAFDQPPPSPFSINAIPACFSTAFSACGTKFAVASQEGMVVVWDVRSHKPLKVYQTGKNRPSGRRGNGGASGRLYEEVWDWGRPGSSAPGWGVRNVKFSPARNGGKELMIFTEHTSLLHVIDARTFEQEDIVSVPTLINDPSPSSSSSSSSSRPSPQPRTPATDTEIMPWKPGAIISKAIPIQ
ncbi:hypothetical protein EWM64_g601 [Hericium alpestre]|uniref:DUF2415 domain-containing protein n=1 Tax=Hericium alpestre TaxID=135208 RepID=A0A4Z0A8N7_9AGAM|nr:hypothetical protein EWM64_g601 [Hericium alpestre]